MEQQQRLSRRDFLKLFGLFTISTLLAGCNNPSPPTPSGYEIPTINPLDTSPLAYLTRFYPHMEDLSNNYKVEHLNTEIPTNIYNFTLNRKIDSDEATKVFSFYDEYVNQNISFPYRFLLSVNAALSVTKRPIIERNIIVVPDDGTSLPAVTTETAVTLYDDKNPNAVKTYTFIKVKDSVSPLQDLDQTDFRKFVVEACQSTVLIIAESDETPYIRAINNLGQEVYCNSFSYELEDRHLELPYQQHIEKFKDAYLFGTNPVIISDEDNYLSMPIFGEIIK